MRLKLFVIFPIAFFYSLLIFGQERIVAPIEYNLEQAANYLKNSRFKLATAGDTITIPFFDDFTQNTGSANPARWVQGGGTFINSTYCINPPNYNVATFDGLNENGTPYNATTITARGAADNLTSKPIDLSPLHLGDSLYLRFYWQGQGMGEVPDASDNDSIHLQFKNSSDVWNTVWKQLGDSTPFNHELIRIGDASQYFYNGFQFKFQSYGKLSGSYDTWNIDYIMLDTGRLAKENWTPDLSFSGPLSSFLKNYTAMPASQYFPFMKQETADSISFIVNSLTNKDRAIKFNDCELLENNLLIKTISISEYTIDNPAPIVTSNSTYYNTNLPLSFKPDTSNFTPGEKERILKYKISFNSADAMEPEIGSDYAFTSQTDLEKSRINFRQNDSISGSCNLTNYYSYDDGSAERGYGVNQILGKIAVKYHLNTPDTLTHVNIYFPRIQKDQSNTSLILSVWSSITPETRYDNRIYTQTIALQHSTALNNFITYKLDTPLKITGTEFYVGYQQSISESIYTGFDVNNDTKSNVFYNVNDKWHIEPYNEGSLMIRPVFASASSLAGIKPVVQQQELNCAVYPNPSTGEIYIEGKVAIMNLYDLSGRLMLSKEFDQTESIQYEDLSSLPKGFYIMHLENGDYKAVKKIILSH